MADETKKLQLVGSIWGALLRLKSTKTGQYLRVSGVNEKGEVTALEAVDDVTGKILSDIADLKKLHPIAISNVTNNVGTKERGLSVDAVTVTWVLNKTPVSQTVEGKAVPADARSAVVPGPFTSGKTFAVTATDAEGNTAKGSTSINFYNGVYYGCLGVNDAVNSENILKLSKKIQSGLGITFTVKPNTGLGERPSFACPESYGTPKFTIGGFEYEWNYLTTFEFENANGYKERYAVYQHPQDVTGSMTITVSEEG